MKFFIPEAKDNIQAEEVYSAILKNNNGIKINKRIFKISFYDDEKRIIAEVGKQIDGNNKTGNQKVIAIVETETLYCIFLPTRGILSDAPIYVGKNESNIQIEYFD